MSKQVHSRFKLFMGPLGKDGGLDVLAGRVEAFATDVASKSIGIEYVEQTKMLVISLGYADGDAYPIELVTVPLGHVDLVRGDFGAVEAAMSAAADRLTNVICHELFITGDDQFSMVIMRRR